MTIVVPRTSAAVRYLSVLPWQASIFGVHNSMREICFAFNNNNKKKKILSNQSLHVSQFSSVQLLSCVRLFETPWIAAHLASLSISNSQSSPKLMCIESVMPSSHLILCHHFLLLPPIPPSIRVFPNESTPRMRWPKYWSFSLSISPSNEHPDWSPLGWTGCITSETTSILCPSN